MNNLLPEIGGRGAGEVIRISLPVLSTQIRWSRMIWIHRVCLITSAQNLGSSPYFLLCLFEKKQKSLWCRPRLDEAV